MLRQSWAVAAGRVEHLADLGQRGRQVGAGVQQLQILDLLANRFLFQPRRGHDHTRRAGHLHEREAVALALCSTIFAAHCLACSKRVRPAVL